MLLRQVARYGLMVGFVGMCIIVAQVWLPLISLFSCVLLPLAGAVAGMLSIRAQPLIEPRKGVALGATSGAIAGALMAVGLVVAGMLLVAGVAGMEVRGERPPVTSVPGALHTVMRLSSLMVDLVVNIGLSAAGGALGGYLALQKA